MKRLITISIFLILCATNSSCQDINDQKFNDLLVKYWPYFDKENNRYFGCGMMLGCLPIFTQLNAKVDKSNKTFFLTGYIDPVINNKGDTSGTKYFKIFLAKSKNGKLRNLRQLIAVSDKFVVRSGKNDVNLDSHKFTVYFKFSKKDRLYIEGNSLQMLKEYDIGSLLMTHK